MKKINFAIFMLIIGVCIFTKFALNNTYASNGEYSKKELQDIVVSTALSYLYNNKYSDYEQKTMGSASNYNWRSFNYSPEMINRGNQFFIDCSSFVSSVYIHSLGYDFSKYYELSGSAVHEIGTTNKEKFYTKSAKNSI